MILVAGDSCGCGHVAGVGAGDVASLLSRQKAKKELVHASSVTLIVCLAAAFVLFIGIVLFVFDFIVSPEVGLWAGVAVLVLVLLIWVAAPLFSARLGGVWVGTERRC